MKFFYLTLNDLLLGLRDLTKERLPKVSGVSAIGTYGPRLQARLAEIEALPEAGSGGEPFAEELAAKDLVHDGHGAAIWFLVEACVRSPAVSAELKATLTDVRARFIPELAELKRPHADEAAAAIKREPDASEMADALRAVHVPGGTLLRWVVDFIQAGKDLDALLRKRADAVSPDRSRAGTLRGATIGQLNRLRAAIEDELEEDAERHAALDMALFAYFDELEKRRTPAAAVPATPAPPAPAPPTPA